MSRIVRIDGVDYLVEEPLDGCSTALVVIGFIAWAVGKLVAPVAAWLNAMYESVMHFVQNWFLVFHFDNFFECALHLYVWIVYVPILALLALAVGGLLCGIILGFWSGSKLTGMVPLGESIWEILGKVLIWLVLTGICLVVCGGIGLFFFLVFLKLIHLGWELLCGFKDKYLKMSWCNNFVFGLLLYLVIPVLLLVGFLVTRGPRS